MCSRQLEEEEEEEAEAACGGGDCVPGLKAALRMSGIDESDDVKCKKCGDEDAVLSLRDNDTYCMNCLQVSVNHKFRSCLGKSRLMRSGERVLIAFSGGPSSALLLTLTKQGLAETAHKRLRFDPFVIYIDDSTILNVEDGVRKENFRKIESYVRDCGFPLFVTSLEKVFAILPTSSDDLHTEVVFDETVDKFPFVIIEKEVASLKELFDSVKSVTCKEDLLVKLRQRLLRAVARSLKCSKVFLGDSETRIAVRVLSDIAQGKGRHISLNCGFADNSDEDVLILRPMREILAKEISYLVNKKQIPCVAPQTFATKNDARIGIQHLTESFVFGLQDEFPSTVSTIFRTGDKMGSSIKRSESKKQNTKNFEAERRNCSLCSVPLDRKVISKEGKTDESCLCDCLQSSNDLQKGDIAHSVCYSCRIIYDEAPMINDFVRKCLASDKDSSSS